MEYEHTQIGLAEPEITMTEFSPSKPIYVTKPISPNLENYNNRLKNIWAASNFTNNGPEHLLLEEKLKNYLREPHLSLFNNGTLALLVAIKALEITGEVITTPFTFPGTVHALAWNGLTPVFCDIDLTTMNIDAEKIEALITPRTSAILAVHVYGIPCNVKQIEKIAKKYNLKVIYDAAHAFGAEIDGRPIGHFGDVTMFSFHATKLFHTAEGGGLVFPDSHLKEKIELLKNFGIQNQESVSEIGINGKMSEIQAALGLVVLDEVENERNRRTQVEKTYSQLLKVPGIYLAPEGLLTKKSLQYFVIRIDPSITGISRDFVHDELKKMGIFTRKYFYPLCSQYPCYNELPSAKASLLPVANLVVNQVLCLPFYGDLCDGTADAIAHCILRLIGKNNG